MTHNKKQGIRLYSFLEDRRVGVSKKDIMDALSISDTTFKEALRYLRHEMAFTIFEPRQGNGYRLEDNDKGHINIGQELLLSQSQLTLLLDKITLLDKLTNTKWINEDSITITKKLGKAVGSETFSNDMIEIIEQHTRKDDSQNLVKLIEALKSKSVIHVDYQSRSSHASKRSLSPQRLIHFQSNWYLVAFCHLAQSPRLLAIEKIMDIDTSKEKYVGMCKSAIKKIYTDTYGIFGGERTENAVIIFDAHITKWVQDECWHVNEQKSELTDGRLQLTLPIGEELTGLLNDLMRYVDCIVDIAPQRLKDSLLERLEKASKNLRH